MRWKIPNSVYYFSAAGTFVGLTYLYRDYVGGPRFQDPSRLEGKVIIVTGANSGIGKETAKTLAERGAKVILACRDMEKCELARFDIVLSTKNKYVYCRHCDLASQQSIRNFVKQFKREFSRLDVLINNAGVMRCPKNHTREGIEMQLGVNHMGHFLLTNLLLDVLIRSAPARIVNVSSSAFKSGKINLEDLNSDKEYDPGKAYAQSKLANILFTRELANRLSGTGVLVNAVDPGIANTAITRHMYVYDKFYTRIFVRPLTWLMVKTPKQAAQTVLYAAVDKTVNNISGAYLKDCKVDNVSEDTINDQLGKWLWLVSEKWTNLNTVA